MTSAEFTRWIAYIELEPFGYPLNIWLGGLISSTVANVAPRKKGMKPLKISDFYPPKRKRVVLTPRQDRELKERRSRKKIQGK